MSDQRLTDLLAIRRALYIAIESEDALIDCWMSPIAHAPKDMREAITEANRPQVESHEKNIAAFRRVLDRYFGGVKRSPLDDLKPVPLTTLLKNSPLKHP